MFMVATGDRFDDPAADAGLRELTASAAGANPGTSKDLVNGRPSRAQAAQLGAGSDAAPWARKAVTSAPTTGGAPIRNASGSARKAAARLHSAAGWLATAVSAAWI